MDAATLESRARDAEALVQRGRHELVALVRKAYADGLSQREIARAVGKSQPEVNRLIRFHGSTPNANRLRRVLPTVKDILTSEGLYNPRVFGSTARGSDGEGSDIDLLVTARNPLGLFAQARVELRLAEAIGVPVDLVLDNAIRPDLEQRILAEAIPL